MPAPGHATGMDVPPLVRDRLEGESVVARVALGGDDAVFVTPTRTLVYRDEGLLSDESVADYPHDVERLALSRGRRKATFELTYVDTDGTFTVPVDRADDVLEPLFGGILAAAGVTEEGERIREVYQFSELTLVVTDGRLLKHVGNTLWDEDFETVPFEDVTGLGVEEGSVATQLVVELAGRPHRVKVPSERGESVRRTLRSAVLEYHGVDSVADLREKQGVVDEPTESRAEAFAEADIAPLVGDDGDGTATTADPSDASGRGDADAGDESPDRDREESSEDATATGTRETDPGVSSAAGDDAGDPDLATVIERLDALEAAVERQADLVEAQQTTIETLVDELRRGR